jgi:hypothetical protein
LIFFCYILNFQHSHKYLFNSVRLNKRLMAEALEQCGFIAPGLSRGLNLKKEKLALAFNPFND